MEKIYRIFLGRPLHKPQSKIHAVVFWIMFVISTGVLLIMK